jgi:hypothetical protein
MTMNLPIGLNIGSEGELVHRSVHVQLKKMPVFAGAEAASLG